jgi:hypothetical protein
VANPWDIPPTPSIGDAQEDAIFTAIGRCLCEWENVEHDLAKMFAEFTGCSDAFGPEPAMRAYGTIVSFRGRADMVAAAAQAYFLRDTNEELEEGFKNILKAARGWADRRNDVAHSIILGLDAGNYLVPSLYNTKKYPISASHAAYAYSSKEIDSFTREIENLATQTFDYLVELQAFGLALKAKSLAAEVLQDCPQAADQTDQQSPERPSE